MKQSEAVKLKGMLKVYNKKTMKLMYEPDYNTIMYVGFDWFLLQAMGQYTSNRPVRGMRIGNGGGYLGAPLPNDVTLTDVRAPIESSLITQDYLPTTTLTFSHAYPFNVIIEAEFSWDDYNHSSPDDFNGNEYIDEAGLWVPPVTTDPILVSYTSFRNTNGDLVQIPAMENLDLLFKWELRVQ